PVLDQLAQAGAINLGALAMAEDACSATGQTEHLPTPVNPLGAHLAVGGSSSGSAVAVASGMVYASLGTDTAGSVRIPAMTCGVLGLKTTHGLIDRQAMAPLCPSLDSIGVLARRADDIASVMRVLAVQLDWTPSAPRVAYWLDESVLDPAIASIVAGVMPRYTDQRVDMGSHEANAAVWQEVIMTYEVAQTHRARLASGQACRQVVGLGRTGLAMPEAWWQLALAKRKSSLQAFMGTAFAHADVLLAPLQVDVLPTVDEVYVGHQAFSAAKLLGLHHYCGWVNYLGLPALSVPVGRDDRGLPVSIQLIGKPFGEPQLLALGQKIQTEIYGEQGIMPVLRIPR
ncbi:MAG TPA: amidase, partial [Orrella sp.]